MTERLHQDSFFSPNWPAPAQVRSCITTRQGGESAAPYANNNLALHVGDDSDVVQRNRSALISAAGLPATPQWLEQIHGIRLVEARTDGRVLTADGCFSRALHHPCAVLTADCLPVLLCDRAGTQVAAVHAGWRGLAAGIVREAVTSFSAPTAELLVYLGPAIGPDAFEVGIDVLEAFFDSAVSEEHAAAIAAAFRPCLNRPLHFFADIYALARADLVAAGVPVAAIYGGDLCTYSDPARFYSYRRDGVTGRMASLIWLA